jgi:hypothetical protein
MDPAALWRNAVTATETTPAATAEPVVVYDLPNGFADNAAWIYKWLRAYNLTPAWGDTSDGRHRVTLPASEVPCLRLMQKHDPARFGNPPDGA